MTFPVTLLAGAALVAWLVVLQPIRGRLRYRRLVAALTADPSLRPAFYRRGMRRQWLLAAAVLVILSADRTPWARIGLTPQLARDAALLPALLEAAAAALAVVVLLNLQRRRWPHRALAETLLRPVAALLPRTREERRLFAGVSVTAGVTEELLYRGFLPLWLVALAPGLGETRAMLLAAAAFGVAHAYQGILGVLGTALVGAALGSMVLVTGSLLLPMVVHALLDLRILLLVPRARPC